MKKALCTLAVSTLSASTYLCAGCYGPGCSSAAMGDVIKFVKTMSVGMIIFYFIAAGLLLMVARLFAKCGLKRLQAIISGEKATRGNFVIMGFYLLIAVNSIVFAFSSVIAMFAGLFFWIMTMGA